jgi:hypothetical protein
LFAEQRPTLDTSNEEGEHQRSDDALRVLAPGLTALGFVVETGKTRAGKIPRPVLFGDQGAWALQYEIDAFHGQHGIALEVEAARATMGNAIYRDLVQASLIVDVAFLVLAVPIAYRYRSGSRRVTARSYRDTLSVVEAIYTGDRLRLPFEGLLVVGY